MKKFPVAEIFGPTVQGEGVDQGVSCYFVRFGGCDFKCDWCDTPHAVLPQAVRHLQKMDEEEILDALGRLPRGPRWVVLSGGNPALHDLSRLSVRLRSAGMHVAVETQGTRYRDWFADVNRLCISPKPPSSGMKYTGDDLMEFLEKCYKGMDPEDFYNGKVFVKVVVFDHTDYEFAKALYLQINDESMGVGLPFYLSAGNDAGMTVGNPSRRDERSVAQVRDDLLNKTRWLINRTMVDPIMDAVIVQSQFHVLLWGNEKGR